MAMEEDKRFQIIAPWSRRIVLLEEQVIIFDFFVLDLKICLMQIGDFNQSENARKSVKRFSS